MDDKERIEQATREGNLSRLEEELDWEQAEIDFSNAPVIATAIAAAFLLGCLALSCT